MDESSRGVALRVPEPVFTSRRRRAIAVALSAVVLLSVIPLAAGLVNGIVEADVGGLFFYLVFLLLPVNLGLVGAVLTFRRPENRIGWLLLVAGALAGVAFGSGEYVRFAISAGRQDAALLVPAAWVASSWFVPAIGILIVFLPLLYPTGRLPSGRWRALVVLAIIGIAGGAIGPALAPGPMGDPHGPLNPLVPPEPWATWIQTASTVSNLIAPPVFLLALTSLLLRFRRSAGVERQQIKWFLFVAVIASSAFAVSILGAGTVSDAAWAVGILTMGLLPLAIGLAILRYRLYEIDRIVNRALVYGAVTAILAGAFAAATALSQRFFISVAGRSSDAAIVLTTLVVVAIYAPVRKRVEAVVDRYFKYDQREYGPYLDELRRFLDLVEPKRAAARLAREAMTHTRAVGVAVTGRDGAVLASAGTWPAEPTVSVALGADDSIFSAVLLGPRRDGKPHPPARLGTLHAAATVVIAALREASGGSAQPVGAAHAASDPEVVDDGHVIADRATAPHAADA